MNKEVDVPIKVLTVFQEAEETNYTAGAYAPKADQDGDNVKKITSYSYPFSVLGMSPGADPRPTTWQLSREKLVAAKRAFAASEGYWPNNKKVLSEWQASQRKTNG